MQYLPDNLVSLLRSEVTIASVPQCVAELVHNSLDAKASHIDIFLRLSPFYMLVKDDGHGITPDDMHHIGRRHCKSVSYDGD
jgi:DNA mismatch repair protein MLH3